MNQNNRDILDKNRYHYDTLIKAFYMRSLDGHTRSELQRIMGEEFRPGYTTDLWCPPCISDMVKQLYQHYDKWLAEQPPPVAEPERDPVNEEFIVKANFPLHDKEAAKEIMQLAKDRVSHINKNHHRK